MFFQCANVIFRVPLELELILHVPEEPRKTSSPFHLDINSTHAHFLPYASFDFTSNNLVSDK